MRQIPTITKNLLIINVLVYLATVVLAPRGIDFYNLFGLHFVMAPDFALYQLVTYMFMHGSLSHLFFNMFALWMFGCTLERVWGEKRFLYFTLACGIGAGLIQEAAQFVSYGIQGLAAVDVVNYGGMIIPTEQYLNLWNCVGFSGAVYGILLGFGMTFPEERIFIFPLPVPIKGKWFVCLYAAIELFSALGERGDGVAHVAHLGGMLVGYIIIKMWTNSGGGGRYGGWDGYEIREKESLWDKIKKWFGSVAADFNAMKSRKTNSKHDSVSEADREQAEIDRILEKIRRSGYDSLTDAERRKIFK